MDLQGASKNLANGSKKFELSDPAFQSIFPAGAVYGPCDMGAHAINGFF